MHPCLQVKNENADKTCFVGIQNVVGNFLHLKIASQVAPQMMQNLAGDLLSLEIALWCRKKVLAGDLLHFEITSHVASKM